MNFYPIYKNKKLLPWIKWWLIKGNKVMPKHLSEWINSAEAITLTGVYKGSPLLSLTLNGNTSQTGTPTPEAPVPVNVVKGNNTIKINDTDYQVNLKSKNLFDIYEAKDALSWNNKNCTRTIIDDNNFTLQSNATDDWCGIYLDNLDSSKKYIITFTATCLTSREGDILYLGKTNANSPRIDLYKDIPKNVSFTFENSTKLYIKIISQAQIKFENVQVEKGSTSTTYEPYYDYELCKIGDYQDVIYKENNKWYVDKYINKIVLNGSENWDGTSNYYTNVLQNLIASTPATERILALSNNFLVQGYNYKSNNNLYFHPNKNLQIENPNASYYATLNDWKAWLSTHNTTVYYVLATSTTTEITETNLINQLEAIYNAKLQSGTNTIMQLPSDLPFYLNFQYYEKG